MMRPVTSEAQNTNTIKDFDKEHILREIDNLRKLQTPLVVKMVDIVKSFQKKTAIILELCDGSLQTLID